MANRNDFKLLHAKCIQIYENVLATLKINKDSLCNLTDTEKARYGFYYLILQTLTDGNEIEEFTDMICDTEFNSRLFDNRESDEGIDAAYFDNEHNQIVLFSFKYREKFSVDKEQNINELISASKFFNAINTGELYLPGDKEILKEQVVYQDRLYDYNLTKPSESEKRMNMLTELLGDCGEGVYIEAPFFANFGGHHCHFGKMVYANYNLTCVDDSHIYVGDYTMIGPNVTIVTAAHYVENLILLTATQHNTKAHPKNNTQIVDKDYQLVCLLAKSDTIEQSLRQVGEKYYRKESFVYVINTGLSCELSTRLSFSEIKSKLIHFYNCA